MRIGRYPIASSIVLALFIAKLMVQNFAPAKAPVLDPWFDRAIMAATVIFLLYYVRVWVGAWLNDRRENAEIE